MSGSRLTWHHARHVVRLGQCFAADGDVDVELHGGEDSDAQTTPAPLMMRLLADSTTFNLLH